MANTILTPVTLWRDFDENLPLEERVLSEWREGGIVMQELRFSGRATEEGRIDIYAQFYYPEEAEQFPAVMILFEAGLPFDEIFVQRFVANGYGVLCVDYSGDDGTGNPHTIYPKDIDYANFSRAGWHINYAEPTARDTSWYEWAGVARYAARYLSERTEVTSFGAIGLRTGGEILFKIAPYAPISCMISVCAAGWLAYRNMSKFGEGETRTFDEERHRFIAGIDSQSYAPYVKCPVLLLCPINDRKYNYERIYDTFRQINPEVEKAILFSAHGNGLIGSHSLTNLDLFLDKYLKGHSVFVANPIDLTVGEDEEGNLVVKLKFDRRGEIKDFGVFFTEKVTGGRARDWTRVYGKKENLAEGEGIVPLSIYKGIERALVYAFVNYSNNFSVTSKILEVPIKAEYKNLRPKTRVIYTSSDGLNGFTAFSLSARSVADCFNLRSDGGVRLIPGYGGIMGVTSSIGMISYRVGEPRYEPPQGAALRFDAWCAEDAKVRVSFFKGDERICYSFEERVEGGGVWKSILLDADDFKSETGAILDEFSGVFAVLFEFTGEVVINNVLWI